MNHDMDYVLGTCMLKETCMQGGDPPLALKLQVTQTPFTLLHQHDSEAVILK